MRLSSILLIGICSMALAGAAERTIAPATGQEVSRRIGDHVSQPKFSAAMWGVKIVSLESGATIFETNAQKLLKPASNAKTFSGALALDVLGPNYKIRTSLLAKSAPDASGTLKSDLVVYGRGDPTFSARFQENYANLFGRMIEAFQKAGIKRIQGDLVGDETFFAGPRFGANWTWDDLQYYYGAEVSALSYQDNVIDIFLQPGAKAGEPGDIDLKPDTTFLDFANRTRTTGTNVSASISVMRLPGERRAYVNGTLPVNSRGVSDAVTVPDPALWFVTSLREELQRAGIEVVGKVRTRSWPENPKLNVAEWKELAFTESFPMSEIVAKMLKASQNLYAQLLLLQVGAQSKSRAATTEDAGLVELRAFAKRAGIDPGEVLLDEGSGLSRSSMLTANALVSLHTFMAKHPHGAIYREALPAPGEGTLRSRFRDLSSAKLRAKTGTLKYVNTLSGYIDTAANEKLAFALILNAYDNDGSASSRDELDVIVRLLAGMREKTRR